MPRCTVCDREIKNPSWEILQKALEAKAQGKTVHWDCPLCRSLDSVVGVIVPPGTDPSGPKTKIKLFEPGQDHFHSFGD